MKRKMILRMLAVALVFCLGSGEALAAADVAGDTTGTTAEDVTTVDVEIDDQTEELNLEYSYDFIYTQANDSVELSPSSVKASDVVELAYPIIVKNEGGYATVTADDNGALSIGRIQWHGNRAMQLMREIIETDPNKAYTLLGKDLYEEVTDSSTKWGSRILTSEEATIISAFLSQMSQSKAVQDKMAKADIAVYVNHGIALGIRNVPALIYFSDLENQGGYGRSSECAKKLISSGICKNYGSITLNEIYLAAVSNSVMGKSIYLGRRTSCYQNIVNLGYPYCSEKDSIIPCVMNKFYTSGYEGEAWLQWALNVYAGADLEITNEYDSATKAAVKAFQSAQGLEADGQAGKATLKELAIIIIASGVYNPGDNTVVRTPDTTPEDGEGDADDDTDDPAATGTKTATITVSKTKWEANDTDANFALNAKSNHTESALTYKSSDEKIAKVTADGKVDPVGPGTATVTISQAATANYKAVTKTVTVIVYDDDVTKYTTPTATLAYKKSGMKENDIMWLQAALNQLNGADLLVDGDYGSATDKAVKAFQTKAGTTADGEVGPNTRSIITRMLAVTNSTPAVKTSGSTKGVTVSWDKNTNASFYRVYRSENGSDWKQLTVINNNSTVSYTDTTGTAGTKYYYTVRSGYTKGSLTVLSKFNKVTGTKTKPEATTGTSQYPVPTRTLKVGTTGNDVKWMQQGINEVLGSKMPVDGEFGNNTKKYVIQFQTKYGLAADGIFGTASRNKLKSLIGTTGGSTDTGSTTEKEETTTTTTGTSKYPVPTRTLKVGTTGNDVKWMQQGINEVLGSKMPVDGEFGNNTKKYVIQFQTKYGLAADGIFGTASRNKLKSLVGTTGGSTDTGSTTEKEETTTTTTSQYPVPTRTLKVGTTGNDVKWMQQGINKVLGSKMPVDGEFGNNTKKYVIQFQTKYGLAADGIFGTASINKLKSLIGSTGGTTTEKEETTTTTTSQYPVPTRTLKAGHTGNDVKWMQQAINKVIGSKMPVDGEFGNNTKKYVIQFQSKYGLDADGIFGPASLKKLKSLYN